MTAMAPTSIQQSRPPVSVTAQDAELARDASRVVAAHLQAGMPLRLMALEGTCETVVMPGAATRLVLEILKNLSACKTMTLIPVDAELTTQQAADLLNVSRPFLIQRLERGEIPYRTVGRHRRILSKDLFAYKAKIDASRRADLDDLAAEAQELGLGY